MAEMSCLLILCYVRCSKSFADFHLPYVAMSLYSIILEDDGDIRRTRTPAACRKRSPSKTAKQTEVHLPGDWLRHRRCRASATWEQWEVRLAADCLRKQRRRAEETVQQRGSRLKRLRSMQAQRLAAETEEQRVARLQQLIAIRLPLRQ